MSFIETFRGSFHSADTYRTVRAAGKFYMGYALIIVILSTLAVTIHFTQRIDHEIFTGNNGKPALFDEVTRQIASQLPTMTLNDNTLTTEAPGITVIRATGSAFGMVFDNQPVITIDTSGETTHTNMRTPILVTTTEMVFKDSKETKIKPLSEFTDSLKGPLLIDPAKAQQMANTVITTIHDSLNTIYIFVGAVVWFFITVYVFIARMIMLLLLGAVGIAIGNMTKSPIKFANAVGLASVSYTPIAVLDTILFAGFGLPVSGAILFLAGAVALFAAIRCTQGSSQPAMIG